MKLALTKKEYGLLLDLVGIARWILLAHQVEELPELEPYKAVIQKIYSFAGEAGYGDRIVRSGINDEFQDLELEDGGEPFRWIEAYNDMQFWEELAHRLAGRDAQREAEGLSGLDRDAEFALFSKHLSRYYDELAEHGLDRLHVVDPDQPKGS